MAQLASEFDFELPQQLIAQQPVADRSQARLLRLDDSAGEPLDARVADLPELLRPADLLVFNNTRVYPARLAARKQSGGAVGILVERIQSDTSALCLLKASRAPATGSVLTLASGHTARVVNRQDDLFELYFELPTTLLEYLEQVGELPLPPYIQRAVQELDRKRYQTVYASQTGAVAAPTAGLHFDTELMQRCAGRAKCDFLTLHVGAGTFQPVRNDDIEQHKMHAERVCVSASLVANIERARAEGGRVIAIGTTVVRALETAAGSGTLQPFAGDTRLFIKPGDRFRVIDAVLTNFHLPRSTLLMLVCAFGGMQRVLAAYRIAVQRQYRFFSYGDAMLLTPSADGQTHR